MTIRPLTSIAIAIALFCQASTVSAAQNTIDLNAEWRFLASDAAGAESPEYDDSGWERTTVPHTWNAKDVLDDEPGYRRGIGWYRKNLSLESRLKGKRVYIYFEGANQVADVFVNGRTAGQHIGGYTAFSFDVTALVKFGEVNTVAVRVDNSLVKDIPPIDGDFNMYGGIYRDVRLIVTDKVHFRQKDTASPGTVIRTPKVSASSAEVHVSGTIFNAEGKAANLRVVSTILDANGRSVGSTSSSITVAAGASGDFTLRPITIAKPRLWSPDDPYLHTIRTTAFQGSRETDRSIQPLGFRWFRFDPAEGFFLNGKPLKLRGTNRHQDRAGYGNALPDDLNVRDMEIIKEGGFNFVRLAHYPQDPSILEAADRLGLMVWEEIPIVNQIHVSEGFNRNSVSMLREMIRQHRHHPSVIVWGFMNEVFLPVPKTPDHVRATVDLARLLEKTAKEEDPSRATAIAFDHGARNLYNSSGLGDVTQIVGWNLYHGWYYESFADLGKFLDDQHRLFPKRVLMVSEYGANGDLRVHSHAPVRFDSSIEWQRMFHEAYLPQINARKYLSGSAIWNYFDFGSEFRGETIPHVNQKGLFTFGREPKDISFFYKASFSEKPVLHIAVRDWKKRSGPARQSIDVYSNLEQVELFANGISLGPKSTNSERKATWQVLFREGSNTLSARSRHGNATVTDVAEVIYKSGADLKDIAINSGAHTEYLDDKQTVWQADREYLPGGWGYVGTSTVTDLRRNILGTEDDGLLQTFREGMSAYRFDIPGGVYEVRARFVEPKHRNEGERVFTVTANNRIVIENLDIFREAGLMRDLARTFIVSVPATGGLTVGFLPNKGAPVVSGISVRRAAN